MALSIAVGLLFTNRRLGTIAGVLAVLMALARVYVGAHYPGDVVAGLALGAVVAAAAGCVAVPLLTRVAVWMSRTAVRALITSSPPATDAV